MCCFVVVLVYLCVCYICRFDWLLTHISGTDFHLIINFVSVGWWVGSSIETILRHWMVEHQGRKRSRKDGQARIINFYITDDIKFTPAVWNSHSSIYCVFFLCFFCFRFFLFVVFSVFVSFFFSILFYSMEYSPQSVVLRFFHPCKQSVARVCAQFS